MFIHLNVKLNINNLITYFPEKYWKTAQTFCNIISKYFNYFYWSSNNAINKNKIKRPAFDAFPSVYAKKKVTSINIISRFLKVTEKKPDKK